MEVQKTEVEEKKRVEEKWKAEEVEERCLKEEHDKALAKWRAEEAKEKKRKAREAEETWRMEEAEEKKRKADKAKALADQIVENHWRSEEARKPSSSKAVVPRSIRGVLLSALTAHQIVSEIAWSQEKMPKALGSGPTISLGSDSDLDNWEDCDMCLRQNWKCTWDLRGKAKSCIPCQDNKQRCEPRLELG